MNWIFSYKWKLRIRGLVFDVVHEECNVGTRVVSGRYGSHLPLFYKAGVAFPYTLISATVVQYTPPTHPLRSCKSSTFRTNEKNYKGREKSGTPFFHSLTQPLLPPNPTKSTPIFYSNQPLVQPLLRSESSFILRNSAAL